MIKKKLLLIFVALSFFATACESGDQQQRIEREQQSGGVQAITKNQPVPDLGGYSNERQIVIETFLARNSTIATYTYMVLENGLIIEICPSIAVPIPYSTQLTNPVQAAHRTPNGGYVVIDNPEANGLYPPRDAEATWVQCVTGDGEVSPVYVENRLISLPYRIQSDLQMTPLTESSFKLEIKGSQKEPVTQQGE